MALKKSITKMLYGQLIDVNDAYHRVASIEGSKDLITLRVDVYTSDILHLVEVKMYQFTPNAKPNASEILTQCYEYLKTQPEFEGAIDC